ncbi:hypothetical protein NONO_c72750 [Nocardia nova SH22a]|uniref:DUF1707 domain-containing protein n=1 Tax=Nocardia nova SH22a TaxID=1415166 RepID=W5TRY2_9NOCA|nr:DUF1707 domain-containing protein [Nocardia nova]AHH22032.1 hypothetical protein NONO_c72750 [Nocardia nova SH22a]
MDTPRSTTSRRAGASRNAKSALRVRDKDRVDACALLDAARDDGQLTETEHAERTRAAMNARTFGALDAVVDDLQIPANLVDAPVVRPARRGTSRRWIPVAGVVVAAALIGMLCGWTSSESGPVGERTPPDMTTGAGIEAFLAAYRDHFGDLLADEVTLFPEYASIERPVAGDPSKSERFTYRGKFGSGSTTSREPDVEPLDLGQVDVPKLAALLAGVPRTIGAPQAHVDFLDIERSTLGHDKPPSISIHADGGGYVTVGLDGEPLYVSKAKTG